MPTSACDDRSSDVLRCRPLLRRLVSQVGQRWRGCVGECTEVVRRVTGAYDAGDMDAYVALVAPDVVFVDNGAPAVRGRDALRDVVTMQRHFFPDQTVERTHWVEEGEWVAFR